MRKVTSEMSMSLDGCIAGPNVSMDEPLGEGGDRLHEWIYDLATWRERHGLGGGQHNADADVAAETFVNKGALVMGRTMFDLGEGT